MSNRLSHEKSLYLQAHKDNPIDWWPYGSEALNEAKTKNKLIFISIGYSSCHWCHVMERESFSDVKTSNFMNDHFISIKVDRDERPDIDRIYQKMYLDLTGQAGGHPLSIWLTPDSLPIHIGTYYPKKFTWHTKTFISINKEIVNSWSVDKNDLIEVGLGLSRNVDAFNQIVASEIKKIIEGVYDLELNNLEKRYDLKYGGFDFHPKFPRFNILRYLLMEGYDRKLSTLIEFVTMTFYRMTRGGIYDQIGGGLFRYSVDQKWRIPHFEKMLYDNAGLLSTAADLYSLTNDNYVEFIIKDTISFLMREMHGANNLFFSSIDAESNGIEGLYYTWSKKELKQVLGIDYPVAKNRYGIDKLNNFNSKFLFNGVNVLKIKSSVSQLSKQFHKTEQEIVGNLNDIRGKLFRYRLQREKPKIDSKIITSWNAMLITALIKVGEKIDYELASQTAINSLNSLIKHVIHEKGVYRVYESKIPGTLDDYGYLIQSLIHAFEFTSDFQYVKIAGDILNNLDDNLFNKIDEMYYFNEGNGEEIRLIQPFDDSFSSSLSIMIENLFKLGHYLSKSKLIDRGMKIAEKLISNVEKFDGAFNELLISASYYLRPVIEFVYVNSDSILKTSHLKFYLPRRLLYNWSQDDENRPKWEILENRTNVSEPTCYICTGNVCSLPLTDNLSVKAYLDQLQN
ncbi:MAG: thioredoxin domain-containing protein [Candidatus Heimdallarchaeota archaeon]|nr:thioredoxin domain-containing protein [Candidatus Heimdallarchaeota archaeon]MDH5646394.1 thioredoxin domain-containing protein [Candidatus Heimdallarchaeota archaeon]